MVAKPFKRGSRWCVVVELGKDPVTGKRRQQWVYGATRKEVQEAQVKLLRERDTGTSLDPTRLTVAEYLAHWLETVVRPNKAILTYERYEAITRNHLVPAFGTVPLAKLAPAHLAKLYADLDHLGYARNTVRGVHGCAHAALSKAVQWRMIVQNPADLVDKPAIDATPATIWDAPTLAEFLDLIRGRRFEPLYLLALNTGLRAGELLGLRWSDLDLARALLTLSRQQIRSTRFGHLDTPTKGKRARAIALTAETITTLRAHKIRQVEDRLAAGPSWQDENRIFPNGTGGALSERTIRGDWVSSLKRWGLAPMHFHGLRHLHATYLLIAGVHPKVVSERLGHSTTAITMETYSHVTPGLQQSAAEDFAAIIKSIRKQPPDAAHLGAERG